MAASVKVIYINGVFRPLEPVDVPENQELRITIEPVDGGELESPIDWTEILGYDPDSEEEQERRRQAWIEILGYDLDDPANQDKLHALAERQHQALLNLLKAINEIDDKGSGLSAVSANVDKYLYKKDW